MRTSTRKVYSDNLLSITDEFIERLEEIETKLGDDFLINQGLFLMITACFEDSIRELMKIVLIAFPEKMTKDSCTISREQICVVADKGHGVIIEHELYSIFKGGVRGQLENLLKILFNKEYKNEKKASLQKLISYEEKDSILKLEEISLFRNALIHNGGKVSKDINEKVKYFIPSVHSEIRFDTKLISAFIQEYRFFFQRMNIEINKTFKPSKFLTLIENTKSLWYDCFSSPILQFEDYWGIDEEKDLISSVKYPAIESNISGSERVLLSIWRHQFDDSLKTEEFLLCSIDYDKIHELYKGLDDLKFYHQQQISIRNNRA